MSRPDGCMGLLGLEMAYGMFLVTLGILPAGRSPAPAAGGPAHNPVRSVMFATNMGKQETCGWGLSGTPFRSFLIPFVLRVQVIGSLGVGNYPWLVFMLWRGHGYPWGGDGAMPKG